MLMLPQYLDLLDKERQEIFKKLKKFANDYILAGGTAIMLQIGHRLSYDFDCFTQKELSPYLVVKAKKVFGTNLTVQLKTTEIITIKTKEGIEITFVWHPFPILQKTVKTKGISLFHLDDLMANKAYTVGRRNTWRDYVDLFFALHEKLYSLDKIIKLADKKFKGEFNEKLFLGQLTYFKDIKIVSANFIKHSFAPSYIQLFLEKQVEEYLKKVLKI